MSKSTKISPASFFRQSGPFFEAIQKQKPSADSDSQEEIERIRHEREQIRFLQQKDILEKQEKLIYDRNRRETEKEIVLVRQKVKEIAKKLIQLDNGIDKAIEQPTIKADTYELSFWQQIKLFLEKIKKRMEDASLWLTEFNKRKRKKGDFWGIATDKKRGGSQFLLSGEHYVSRSAG